MLAEEDHRAGIAEAEVMVLDGVLEDLLHCSCASWGIDDSTLGDCQYQVLTGAVVEVLCDMCSERGSRFMSIKPCRHTKADIFGMRECHHHSKCSLQPELILKRRCCTQDLHGLMHGAVLPSRQPGAQMGRLHGSRASAADHHASALGQLLAHQSNFKIFRICAQQAVSSHDSHHTLLVECPKEIVHSVVHRMVMENARQRFLDVSGLLALCQIMFIYLVIICVII